MNLNLGPQIDAFLNKFSDAINEILFSYFLLNLNLFIGDANASICIEPKFGLSVFSEFEAGNFVALVFRFLFLSLVPSKSLPTLNQESVKLESITM